jgi:hypothetical protein
MKILFRAIFIKKIFWKKLAENLLGSGSRRFQKSDPDPDKIVRIRNTAEYMQVYRILQKIKSSVVK